MGRHAPVERLRVAPFPLSSSARCVAGRGYEPAEFSLDEASESERRPVLEFGADDLHAYRQTFRDRNGNDCRRQSARRREFGP